MKISASQWCKIQEALANLKCPNCFSARCTCVDEENENAKCEDCGCKFEFNPDVVFRLDA